MGLSVWRRRWTKQKAVYHLLDQSGKHFDPPTVEVFVKSIEK
jgi:response regulator RpfG family c-di-GMP phosphodiesterase